MNVALCFPAMRQHLATRRQLRAAGFTRAGIEAALAAGLFVRVRRGVYALNPLAPRAEHLISGGVLDPAYLAEVRSVLLQLRRAAAGGRTAALLWGFDLAVEPTTVEVAVAPGGSRHVSDVTFTQVEDLEAVEVRVADLDPIPCLSALQTVVHCALHLPRREAVTAADSAMRAGKVTLRELRAEVAARRGSPGAQRIKQVVDWSDPDSGSVLESLFRVLVLEAGLIRPESQLVITDGNLFIGRVDFCWKELRLVVECDGRRWHDPEDVREKDRRRDNSLERLSWRLLRFTWAEVVHDPDYVIGEVRACLQGWRAA